MMKRHDLFLITFLLVAVMGRLASAQPVGGSQPIVFDAACANPDTVFPRTDVIFNNNFEVEGGVSGTLNSWSQGATANPGVLESAPTDLSTQQNVNHFVLLNPNASIVTTPIIDQSNRVFTLRLCAKIEGGGQILVSIGENQFEFPAGGNFSSIVEQEFIARNLRLDLASPTAVQNARLQIWYTGNDQGDGRAFVDNITLFPGEEDGTEPTPTPTMPPTPTPEPTNTPGPEPTNTPTLGPLDPTFTPTPVLTGNSLELNFNPPMIVLSPDDFAGTRANKKQVEIKVRVIGSNGQPIDIRAIDPDATIRFEIQNQGDQTNAGSLAQLMNGGQTTQRVRSEEFDLIEIDDEPIVYVPSKVFDGTVRISATIEFEGMFGGDTQQQEIRGVAPIVFRSDAKASLVNPSGGFDPLSNLRAGRQPGDRGFRPDNRTNLYFRERFR